MEDGGGCWAGCMGGGGPRTAGGGDLKGGGAPGTDSPGV